MAARPLEITLNLVPRTRFDVIDIGKKLRGAYGEVLRDYRKLVCSSFHTTAGFLEQPLCARLNYSVQKLNQFLGVFQRLFPPNAGYFHDRMELREELTEDEKILEPINGDSHLAFMGAGLKNCVTYRYELDLPIYFIDLDGVYKRQRRRRRTTILAYNSETEVYRGPYSIPVQREHPINSFNLKDPRYGLFSHLNALVESYGVEKGLIEIGLPEEEQHAGLTVNEYETLLMRNDLPDALQNPLRYFLQRGKKLLQNPASIPGKTKGYMLYDLVHLYNELMDGLQLGQTLLPKAIAILSNPASRILRLKRSIHLLVSNSEETGVERIVQGTYQSPILIQYQPPETRCRSLEISVRAMQ